MSDAKVEQNRAVDLDIEKSELSQPRENASNEVGAEYARSRQAELFEGVVLGAAKHRARQRCNVPMYKVNFTRLLALCSSHSGGAPATPRHPSNVILLSSLGGIPGALNDFQSTTKIKRCLTGA